MSHEGGADMARRRRTSPAAEPLDDDDLLAEILLRLPPMPSSLPRASLVCKRWRSISTDAAFRRRFRTHHRKPPILGVFQECAREINFRPLLDPPDRIPSERFSLDLSADEIFSWRVLGCRHGRVLLLNSSSKVLLVFEPVSGDTHRILIPPELVRDGFTTVNAAVLCSAGDDHVHGDCHSSPFKVVLLGTRRPQLAVACVYSSETGIWGDVASTAEPCTGGVSRLPCTLIGASLYSCLSRYTAVILQFDLYNQTLTRIRKPLAVSPVGSQSWIIRAEDGGLGLAVLSYPSFQLWDRKFDCHGVATWMLRKNVNRDELLGPKAGSANIVGYAEDADAIFIAMYKASYGHVLLIVHLESMIVKECHGHFSSDIYHPLTNFYTAGTVRA